MHLLARSNGGGPHPGVCEQRPGEDGQRQQDDGRPELPDQSQLRGRGGGREEGRREKQTCQKDDHTIDNVETYMYLYVYLHS